MLFAGADRRDLRVGQDEEDDGWTWTGIVLLPGGDSARGVDLALSGSGQYYLIGTVDLDADGLREVLWSSFDDDRFRTGGVDELDGPKVESFGWYEIDDDGDDKGRFSAGSADDDDELDLEGDWGPP